MNKVLVVIDAQEDFVRGVLGSQEAIKALPVIQKAVNYAENHDMVIFYTRDTHGPDVEDYMKTQEASFGIPPHCLVNKPGWDLCEEVKGEHLDGKIFIAKSKFGYPHYDIYYNIFHNADEIWICGFCTDICVMANFQILKALYPEIPIVVIEDACAGSTPEAHEAALTVLKSCQAIIMEWENLELTDLE